MKKDKGGEIEMEKRGGNRMKSLEFASNIERVICSLRNTWTIITRRNVVRKLVKERQEKRETKRNRKYEAEGHKKKKIGAHKRKRTDCVEKIFFRLLFVITAWKDAWCNFN